MFRRNQGFTLIELLVVITIIAVLAAILFPVFLMARAKAREMGCISNLKQLGGAFAMYTSDWGAYPYTALPSSSWLWEGHSTHSMPTGGNFRYRRDELWTAKLAEYLDYEMVHYADFDGLIPDRSSGQGVAKCREGEKQWWDHNSGILRHPGGMQRDEMAYGYNFLYLGLPFKAYDASVTNPYAPRFRGGAVKPGNVKIPAETVLLVENATVWAFPPFQTYTGPTKTTGTIYIRPRHGGRKRSAVLWCDGHVRTMATSQLVAVASRFGDYNTGKPAAQQRHFQGLARDNYYWDIKFRE